MMTTFNLFLILILPMAMGYCLIFLCGLKKHLPLLLSFSLGYGLGSGLLTVWMFLLGVLNIPLKIQTINYPLAILLLIFSFLSMRGKKNQSPCASDKARAITRIDFLSFIFILYICLPVGYVFWRSFNVPISTWDAFATHAFNAKIIFYEQSLRHFDNFPHNTYPLHIPLLQSWLTLNLGRWDDQLVKAIFPFYFLSTLIVQYYFLRNYTTQRGALLSIVLLVSSPFLIYHATIGYRDLTLLYYNFTTIVLLLLWHKETANALLILASLFAGLTSFTKVEGAGYLFIHTILLIMILRHRQNSSVLEKFKNFIKFCIPSFSICLFFHIYKYLTTTPGPTSGDPSQEAFDLYRLKLGLHPNIFPKLGVVLERIFDNLFFTNNWNMVWFIFFLSCFNIKKRFFSLEIKLLLTAIALFFGTYIFGYTFTQHYYWIAETHTVLSRCILHFFPLIPLLIILINFPTEISKTKKES